MTDKRIVRVILKDQAKTEFEKLNSIVSEQSIKGITNSEEMQLLRSIKQKSELLKINPVYGDKIPHNLIPKNLEVSNLFRVELTGILENALYFGRKPNRNRCFYFIYFRPSNI